MVRKVWVIDRITGEKVFEPVTGSKLMNYLFTGRDNPLSLAAFMAKNAWVSKFIGYLAKCRVSKCVIAGFIKKNKICLESFEDTRGKWPHFEAFFSRRLRKNARPIDLHATTAIIPADGRYRLLERVDTNAMLHVKGQHFSLKDLLEDDASSYLHALVCIARLAPSDYHRFHSPISGQVVKIQSCDGPLFSVHPWSLEQNFSRLLENKRMLFEIENPKMGRCLVIAIGATCVGSIETHVRIGQILQKGDELGAFHVGGSSLIIFMPSAGWKWQDDLYQRFKDHEGRYEVLCQMGQAMTIHI